MLQFDKSLKNQQIQYKPILKEQPGLQWPEKNHRLIHHFH